MRYRSLIAGLTAATVFATGMFGFNPKGTNPTTIVSGTTTQAGEQSSQPIPISQYINDFTLYNLAKVMVYISDKPSLIDPSDIVTKLNYTFVNAVTIQHTLEENLNPESNRLEDIVKKIIEAKIENPQLFGIFYSNAGYVARRVKESFYDESTLKRVYYNHIDDLLNRMSEHSAAGRMDRDVKYEVKSMFKEYARVVQGITEYLSLTRRNIGELEPFFIESAESTKARDELFKKVNDAVDQFRNKWSDYLDIDIFSKPDKPDELDQNKINSVLGNKGVDYIKDVENLIKVKKDYNLADRRGASSNHKMRMFIMDNFHVSRGSLFEYSLATSMLALAYRKDAQNPFKLFETYEEILHDLSDRLRKRAVDLGW